MKLFIKITLLFFVLSYGLFYYAYKFSSPKVQGLKDYTEYVKLYENWDYENVSSPFNSRLVSSYGIYLFNKAGFYYETDIAFTNDKVEKSVFFNGLLFNYIFIVLTGVLIFYFSWFNGIAFWSSLVGGILYIFSFSTMFFYLNPLTEALSAFLTALILLSLFKRNYWYLPILLIALFQREYIFFLIGLYAAFQIVFHKEAKGYFVNVLISTILFFVIYFILRKTLFYTPHHDEQVQFSNLISNVFSLNVSIAAYIKQAFLTQNIFVFYLLLVGYKKIKKMPIDISKLLLLLLLFLQMIVISLFAKLAQTIGRLFFLSAPLIVYFLLYELQPFMNMKKSKKG